MPELLLRPLTPQDAIPPLTRLLHQAYASLAAQGWNYTAADQSDAVTRQRIAGGHCLLAWRGAELVGTITVRPAQAQSPCPAFRTPGCAVLGQFAVAPTHQGQGVGRRLLQAAEDWACAQGCRQTLLDTAEPAQQLVALYLRHGYRPCGQFQWQGKRYQSVLMCKDLEPSMPASTRTREPTVS